MANTNVATALEMEQWRKKFFKEYIRANGFAPYMGTSTNAVIHLVEDLMKKAGDRINVPLITRLVGAGVTGDNTLEGNEEALGNYNHQITVDQARNGVRVGKMEQFKTQIEILDAGREMLKGWCDELLRDDMIVAMMSPVVDGKTPYASATETQKDAWLLANADRVIFGAAVSNNAASDHSAALAEIDNTNDKLTPGLVSLAKRRIRTADRHVRPIKIDGGGEWFVMFVDSMQHRDFKANSTVQQANRDAGVRGSKNPLFQDGDLLWDGVIVREIPEIPTVGLVGASSIAVSVGFLCGAQSLGLAWGQRPMFKTDDFDYGNQAGVAVNKIYGAEKLIYNNIQNGMHTVYTAGVADS